MRVPFIPLLITVAWLTGAGCASAPQQDPPITSSDRDCANGAYDPLHMVSSRTDTTRDPEIESLLNQTADPRLARVNRQMYQSLHALDVELRREQRVAACRHPQSSQTLEARSNNGVGAGGTVGSVANEGSAGVRTASASGASVGGTGAVGGNVAMADGTAGTSAAASPSPAASASSIAGSTAATGAPRSTLVRKSSLSASGSGGNGATAQKVSVGSDNDIVARRLRKAAEQETDPALRAKLWKEYADYRQGTSVK
jgi:hypothetical protein